jgi:hypothetical protein
MKQNRRLFEAWQNGARLRDAWWTFAEAPKKQLFLELESEGLHIELQSSLKQHLTDRLYAGQLCAIGVESESGGGPVYIPSYYFLKTAKIDWDNDTVAALEKEFYHVSVDANAAQDAPTRPRLVGPRPTQPQAELEQAAETPPGVPAPLSEPLNQGERPARDEAIPSEPSPSDKRKMGRPPLVPMVCEVIRELVSRNAFTGLAKWEIERLIRRKARERFPTSFPKPDRPTTNTINKALSLAGWPPPPSK